MEHLSYIFNKGVVQHVRVVADDNLNVFTRSRTHIHILAHCGDRSRIESLYNAPGYVWEWWTISETGPDSINAHTGPTCPKVICCRRFFGTASEWIHSPSISTNSSLSHAFLSLLHYSSVAQNALYIIHPFIHRSSFKRSSSNICKRPLSPENHAFDKCNQTTSKLSRQFTQVPIAGLIPAIHVNPAILSNTSSRMHSTFFYQMLVCPSFLQSWCLFR